MQMHIGEIYAVTAVFSALLTGLVYGRMKHARYSHAIESSFAYMLRFFILFNVVDALWGLCYAGIIVSPAFFTAVGYSYHTLSALSAFVWMAYIVQFTRHDARVYTAAMGMAFFLLFAQLAIIASNPFHHLVFDVSENNEYSIRSLRYVLYTLQFSYYGTILTVSAVMSRFDDDVHRVKHREAFIYSLGPALFCVGQYFFYDVAMYSMGFAYIALLICLYRQSSRIEQLWQEQFRSTSREHLSIIRSIAGKITAIYYVDLRTGQYDRFLSSPGKLGLEVTHFGERTFFPSAREWGMQNLAEDDLEAFLLVMDSDNIVRTLARQSEISLVFKIRQGDRLVYHEGRITYPAGEENSNCIIVGVCDIDEKHRAQLKQNEELARALDRKTALEREAGLLEFAAHRDIMTGLFNRRAYEDTLQEMEGTPDGADFVYVCLDVNKLKAVNDDLGHEAGDELIKGAALCMKQCFAPLGRLYRHGGDEFSAMLHAESDTLEHLFSHFEQTVDEWHGRLVDSLSVSYGYAAAKEFPDASVRELEKIAEQRMYENKNRYYARNGIDRREQQDAYEALRESYTKVLRVDLSNDSYVIIKADESELDSSRGFSEKFSEWVVSFAKSGQVHESDVEEYLQKTNLEFIRKFFAHPSGSLSFRYRRKMDDGFREALMEIIPAKNYAADNRTVFLYVKKVSGDGLYMRLQDIREDTELTVQMKLENEILEFPSAMVGKDSSGIYVRPYMRGGHALKFDARLTDSVTCTLFAQNDAAGYHEMWHDVELKSVETPEGLLYLVSTRDFNRYSRPNERRIHRRTASGIAAHVSDGAAVNAEVVLSDISDTGLSFCVSEPLDFASDSISISFEDSIDGEHFSISTAVKTVRSYAEQGRFFYGCLVVKPSRDYRLYVFMHKLNAG